MTAGKSRKRKSSLEKAWNMITWGMLAIVVLLAIVLVGVRLVGLQPFAVLSGSMEPTYKTGSIVYVKEVDYRELAVGDPITFMLDEKTVATHRIIEILPDAENAEVIRYRTKGDANDTADGGSVHCRNIIGKPVCTIPYLGYAANYIQSPMGRYVCVCACALMILLAFLPDILSGKEDKKQS